MAEQRIPGRDGSVTIVSDSYAPFGEIQVGPPIRPEPVRATDQKFNRKQLGKYLNSSDDELQELMDLPGFPAAGRRFPAGAWGVELIWSQQAVDRWVSDQRALAAKITRLVG